MPDRCDAEESEAKKGHQRHWAWRHWSAAPQTEKMIGIRKAERSPEEHHNVPTWHARCTDWARSASISKLDIPNEFVGAVKVKHPPNVERSPEGHRVVPPWHGRRTGWARLALSLKADNVHEVWVHARSGIRQECDARTATSVGIRSIGPNGMVAVSAVEGCPGVGHYGSGSPGPQPPLLHGATMCV